MEVFIVVIVALMWAILVLPGCVRKKTEYDKLLDQMDEVRIRAAKMEKKMDDQGLTTDDIKELEEIDEDRRSVMAKFWRLYKR